MRTFPPRDNEKNAQAHILLNGMLQNLAVQPKARMSGGKLSSSSIEPASANVFCIYLLIKYGDPRMQSNFVGMPERDHVGEEPGGVRSGQRTVRHWVIEEDMISVISDQCALQLRIVGS